MNYARLAPNHYCSKCACNKDSKDRTSYTVVKQSTQLVVATEYKQQCRELPDKSSWDKHPNNFTLFLLFFLFLSIEWHRNWLRDQTKPTKINGKWKTFPWVLWLWSVSQTATVTARKWKNRITQKAVQIQSVFHSQNPTEIQYLSTCYFTFI